MSSKKISTFLFYLLIFNQFFANVLWCFWLSEDLHQREWLTLRTEPNSYPMVLTLTSLTQRKDNQCFVTSTQDYKWTSKWPQHKSNLERFLERNTIQLGIQKPFTKFPQMLCHAYASKSGTKKVFRERIWNYFVFLKIKSHTSNPPTISNPWIPYSLITSLIFSKCSAGRVLKHYWNTLLHGGKF